jgi:hypothetical protein
MPKHTSLPFHFYVNVNNAFLGPDMPEGVTKGIWHGVYCREYQVLSCHVFLESGAHWSGLPIQALSATEDFRYDSNVLMPWCGMGEEIEAVYMPFLEGLEARPMIATPGNPKGRHTGIIIDWKDGYSRYPEEHKPLNLLQIGTGQFALFPNNYVTYKEKHFVNEKAKENMKHYRRGEEVYWEK